MAFRTVDGPTTEPRGYVALVIHDDGQIVAIVIRRPFHLFRQLWPWIPKETRS